MHTAHRVGVSLAEVEAARFTNATQAGRTVKALRHRTRALAGSRITVLSLTFKAGTSDTRDSPALAACVELARAGAQVMGYDPELPNIDPTVLQQAGLTPVDEPYRAAKTAAAIVVLTEWSQFGELDRRAIAREAPSAVVLDTRNVLDLVAVRAAGLTYLGKGAPEGF